MKGMLLIVVVGLTLTACVETPPPVAAGKDRFLITTNAHGGFTSDGKLLTDAVERANQWCAARGEVAEIESTHTSGVQGWTPQNNEVFFKCGPR